MEPSQKPLQMDDLRKEGGAWLRSLREAAGLSQRDLSRAIGIENHGIISQIESGRIRMAPALVGRWTAALKYPVREFAINLMKYYDPLNYELIFAGEKLEALKPASAPANDVAEHETVVPANMLSSMQDRMNRLESMLSKLQP